VRWSEIGCWRLGFSDEEIEDVREMKSEQVGFWESEKGGMKIGLSGE